MKEEYKLKLEDIGKTLEVDGENPNNQIEIVIPDHSNTPFPIGTQIKVYRGNEKKVTLRGETSNLKLNSSSKAAQNNFSFFIPKFTETQIRKRALNEWHVNAKGVPLTFAEGGNEIFVIEQNGILYRVHVFGKVGESEFEVIGNAGEVEYLIVAGGGGGGSRHGGGGGAGGLIHNFNSPLTISNSLFSIFVGDGGEGAESGGQTTGNQGENSSAFDLTAIGGGAGSSSSSGSSLQNGGSGGGSRGNSEAAGGLSTPGQGSDGGAGVIQFSENFGLGGGGGGFSQIGQTGDQEQRGKGGDGFDASSFLGTGVGESGWFAGGGGAGGAAPIVAFGVAGKGGGGFGNTGNLDNATNGKSNTGGGGGGGGHSNTNWVGKNGGSGIVIVRYEIAQPS